VEFADLATLLDGFKAAPVLNREVAASW